MRLQRVAGKTGRYVIVERSNPMRYLQCLSLEDGGIAGEAVSNHFLRTHEQLTAATVRQLVRLGWQRPARGKPNQRNFCREWGPPVPLAEIAAMAVKTLREGFDVESPLELALRSGDLGAHGSAAATVTLTARLESGAWIPAMANPALRLKLGELVRSALSGREYRVGKALGAGGFGAAYEVVQAGGRDRLPGRLALKVSVEPRGWYREAYFGDLLSEAPGLVRMHEAFAWTSDGGHRQPLYCLVSELVEGGDLTHFLKQNPEPWPEWRARREIIRLLRTVRLIHASGAVHRDITPNNVFVTAERVLKLGDFGIATHRIGRRDVPADSFNGWFAPPGMKSGNGLWRQADDVYHLGQLFALLLHGGGKSRLTAADTKKLSCTPAAKEVIQRSIGERRKRFADADQMLAALEKQPRTAAASPILRSLRDKRVVFTGPLSIPRAQAQRLVKKAGGIVEKQVSHRTDVVVLGGDSPHWKAGKKGQKLLDVDRERELGHPIALITERRFHTLAASAR